MMIKAESNDKNRLFQVQSEPGAKHRSSNCDLRAACSTSKSKEPQQYIAHEEVQITSVGES